MVYYFLGLCKDQWELIYYVAFVLLTVGIVVITAKTYFFQTKKVSEIFCKCLETSASGGNSNLFIEVYNYGNSIAKNIKINIQGVDFGIIPFLKPNESYIVPFAYFIISSASKTFMSNRIKVANNDTINVLLDINGKIMNYSIDISLHKLSTKLSEPDLKSIEKIATELTTIAKNHEQSNNELKKVSAAISKMKK